ncbi:hypothetical protein RKD28_004304 [Streptomyces sp. SAI-229]
MVSQLAPSGLSLPMPVPPQAVMKSSPRDAVRESDSPSQPPTLFRPSTVMGMSAARMTKNCRTSL